MIFVANSAHHPKPSSISRRAGHDILAYSPRVSAVGCVHTRVHVVPRPENRGMISVANFVHNPNPSSISRRAGRDIFAYSPRVSAVGGHWLSIMLADLIMNSVTEGFCKASSLSGMLSGPSGVVVTKVASGSAGAPFESTYRINEEDFAKTLGNGINDKVRQSKYSFAMPLAFSRRSQ
jgi:hypothetical protein